MVSLSAPFFIYIFFQVTDIHFYLSIFFFYIFLAITSALENRYTKKLIQVHAACYLKGKACCAMSTEIVLVYLPSAKVNLFSFRYFFFHRLAFLICQTHQMFLFVADKTWPVQSEDLEFLSL